MTHSSLSPFAQYAESAIEHGLSPLPIVPSEKRPHIKRWQKYCDSRFSSTHIRSLKKQFSDAGIGLATGCPIGGAGSNCLVAVDIDRDEPVDEIRKLILDRQTDGRRQTIVAKRGSRGITIFCVADGVLKSRKFADGAGMVVEILSKGRQTVIPPSVHPDGQPYEWVDGVSLLNRDLHTLPLLTDDIVTEIEMLVAGEDRASLDARNVSEPFDQESAMVNRLVRYHGSGRFTGVKMSYPGNVNETLTVMAAKSAKWNHDHDQLTDKGRAEATSGMVQEALTALDKSGLQESWDQDKQLLEAETQYDSAVRKGKTEWGWTESSHKKPANDDDPVAFNVIRPSEFSDTEIPAREWLVNGWIPKGSVTILAGDGGTGKTLIAHQLMTACATGNSWLGLETEQCKPFAMFCEDSERELNIRQASINRMFDVQASDLAHMGFLSRVGQDNILMGFNGGDHGKPTPLWDRLRDHCVESGIKLVVVDTASDTFGGNEIIRAHVRQFISGALNKLAMDIDGTVLLCTHPSVHGMEKGSGYSGSTAWNNSVRSRLYLSRFKVEEEKADPENLDKRRLSKKKSNYGSVGEEIELKWSRGVFERLGEVSPEQVAVTIEADSQRFLTCMDVLSDREQRMSNSINAGDTFAPKMMAEMEQSGGLGVQRLKRAMNHLVDVGKIKTENIGTKSRPVRSLVRVDRDAEK
jgi:RecA-family ATPase